MIKADSERQRLRRGIELFNAGEFFERMRCWRMRGESVRGVLLDAGICRGWCNWRSRSIMSRGQSDWGAVGAGAGHRI